MRSRVGRLVSASGCLADVLWSSQAVIINPLCEDTNYLDYITLGDFGPDRVHSWCSPVRSNQRQAGGCCPCHAERRKLGPRFGTTSAPFSGNLVTVPTPGPRSSPPGSKTTIPTPTRRKHLAHKQIEDSLECGGATKVLWVCQGGVHLEGSSIHQKGFSCRKSYPARPRPQTMIDPIGARPKLHIPQVGDLHLPQR